MEDTTQADTKRALFVLSQNHYHKAAELKKFLVNENERKEQMERMATYEGPFLQQSTYQQSHEYPSQQYALNASRYYEDNLASSVEAARELKEILGPWPQNGMEDERQRVASSRWRDEEGWWTDGFWGGVEKLLHEFFPKLPTRNLDPQQQQQQQTTKPRGSPLKLSDDDWYQTTAPTPPPRYDALLNSVVRYAY